MTKLLKKQERFRAIHCYLAYLKKKNLIYI
jgi:hypothetical protein